MRITTLEPKKVVQARSHLINKRASIVDVKLAHLFCLVDIKTSTHKPATSSSESLSVSLRPIVGQKRVSPLIANNYKVGCAFPIGNPSNFRIVKHIDDDHEENAPYFSCPIM